MSATRRVRARPARAERDSLPRGDGHLALSVWVRLLKAHGLLLREVRRRVPERLTLPQFDVLAQIHRKPEGMMPRQLTQELLVTAGNLTGIVDRLVRLGFAERRPVPEDRRAVRICLTGRGRRLMQRAIPRHSRDLEAMLGRVPAADLTRLRHLLGRVSRALEATP
jgi:DNA-binding MarR family transcriptional regulator